MDIFSFISIFIIKATIKVHDQNVTNLGSLTLFRLSQNIINKTNKDNIVIKSIVKINLSLLPLFTNTHSIVLNNNIIRDINGAFIRLPPKITFGLIIT